MAGQQQDLLDQVDLSGFECLNESSEHRALLALKAEHREDEGAFLESDADEQLLLKVPFHQSVKLHSIVLKAPQDGSGPKHIKLFINTPSIGFSDVESGAAVQDLDISPAQLLGEPILLKLVKFQRVTHLSIFIDSNQGSEETTKLQKIVLFGSTGERMDVAQIKKCCGQ